MNIGKGFKTGLWLFGALLLVMGSVGPAGAGQPNYVWKLGTLAPKGVGWAKQVEDILVPLIDEKTRGDLELKVYWGGIMGDDEDYLRKMLIDQLQGAGLSGQGTVMACPEIAVVELPFLFKNFDEVDYVRERTRSTFETYFERHGFVLLLWIDQDFDQIYSTRYPMARELDFKKARFLTWYGELESDMLTTLGSRPIPVNVPEVTASVRSGVVDSFIGPAIWVVGAQLYSTLKYVNPIKIRYSPASIILNKQSWDDFPEEYKKPIWEARIDAGQRFIEGTRRDNEKCLNAMVQYGIKKVELNETQLKTLQDATRPVWEGASGKIFPKELLPEILNHISAYRAQQSSNDSKSVAVLTAGQGL